MLLITQPAHCQHRVNQVFKIAFDTAKNQVLPFDIDIYLTIAKNRTNPIDEVYLVRVDADGHFVADEGTSFYNGTDGKPVLDPLHHDARPIADSVTYGIHPLRPDKRYVLILSTVQDANRKKLELVKQFCLNPQKPAIIDQLIQLSEPVYFESENNVFEFKLENKYIIKELEKANSKCELCKALNLVNSEAIAAPDVSPPSESLTLESLYKIPFCDDCHKESMRELSIVTNISSMIEANKKQFFNGKYAFTASSSAPYMSSISIEPAKTDEQKIANLKSNLNILVLLQQSLLTAKSLYPSTAFGTTYDGLLSVSKIYITRINENIGHLERVVDANGALMSSLNQLDIPVGLQFNTLRAGTSSFNFYTRNSYFIKPDFGVIFYGNSSFSGGAPFLGFHINFRATNENVPFWKDMLHNGHLWQIPTLQIGVPVFAQNLSQNESRKYLVADRFSIFTGLGLNVGHSARLHTGALWFQSLSSIQNNEKNYKITAVTYIGFSIDIKLRKLFPGLANAIYGVPGF